MARRKSQSVGKLFALSYGREFTEDEIENALGQMKACFHFASIETRLFFDAQLEKTQSEKEYRELSNAKAKVDSEAMSLLAQIFTLRSLMEDDRTTKREKEIALRAFAAGIAYRTLLFRLVEDDCVVGKERKASATSMRSSKQSFDPSRDQLLKWMKQAARKYPGLNQKDLCAKVAAENGFHIGGERVRQKLRDHKITAAEYKPKDF